MTDVVCLLNFENEAATFTWSEGPASFEPYKLEGQMFAEFRDLSTELRQRLSDLVKDSLHDPERVPETAYELAVAGHDLYLQLFDPGAGEARIAKDVKNWLEQLSVDSGVDTLEIVLDGGWPLPWNVIYDTDPDRDAFLQNNDEGAHWKPFWGIRFDLTGGRKVSPLRRLPVLKDPSLLMVVDPKIRDGLPEEQRMRLERFVAEHEVSVVHNKSELRRATGSERPDLLYWLSHATPSALVLDDEEISPRELRRILRRASSDDYGLGGLAFLNACQTAESGEGGSFFDAFHSLGFSGMVGTEHQTIDTFANPLGLDFLDAFVFTGRPLGEVMRDLRARVPLGLLYGTYCPPNIHIRFSDDSHSSVRDTVKIQNWDLEAGRALGTSTEVQAPVELPDQPYRSLGYFHYADQALFTGRDKDIERFAATLDHGDTRILVLHGESGVGKSSFLRAGVIPYLEESCHGYRFMRAHVNANQSDATEDAVLFVRATKDLFAQLSQALLAYCAAPYHWQTPLGERVEVDLPGVLSQFVGGDVSTAKLKDALANDPTLLGRLLSALSERLPHAAVLVIDQCEEVFTLARTAADEVVRDLALAMLRQTLSASGDFKMILSLRTEYYGRLIDRLRHGMLDVVEIREYLLTDVDEEALVETILRPTSRRQVGASSIPRDKYGFSYQEGVARQIAEALLRHTQLRHDSVLPLMQVICTQLYDDAKTRGAAEITQADFRRLGGVDGGMERHVESKLKQLVPSRDEDHVKLLFTKLYHEQADGSLTTEIVPEDTLEQSWTGHQPFAELVASAERMRLLRINVLTDGTSDRRYVSLGHDALAKIVAKWGAKIRAAAKRRRDAWIVCGSLALAMTMAGLAGLAFWAWGQADRNLTAARNAIRDYYVHVSDEPLLQSMAMSDFRQELLSKGESYLDRLVDDHRNDPRLSHVVAMALANRGRIQENRGQYEAAIEEYQEALIKLGEHHQREGIQLQGPSRPGDAEVDAMREAARTRMALARAQATAAEQAKGDARQTLQDSAKQEFGHARALRRRLADHLRNPPSQIDLASTLMSLGTLARDRRDWQTSRTHLERAREIGVAAMETRGEPDPRVYKICGMIAYNQAHLGRQELQTLRSDSEQGGEAADAHSAMVIDHATHARKWLSTALDHDTDDLDARFYLATSCRMIGQTYLDAGDLEEHELDLTRDCFRIAKENYEALCSLAPNEVRLAMQLVLTKDRLARSDKLIASLEERLNLVEEAIPVAEKHRKSPGMEDQLGGLVSLRDWLVPQINQPMPSTPAEDASNAGGVAAETE